MMEGLRDNLAMAAGILEPYRPAALLGAEVNYTEGIFLLAAARSLGMETIGYQEGAHFGYENDCVQLTEILLPYFDRYVTWGWTRLPPGPAQEVRPVPLPSPWLSQRARHWDRELGPAPERYERSKEFGVLLMPNKVHLFPYSPSGASTNRTDGIAEFRSLLIALVRESAGRGIKLLHKPYDTDSVRLLSGTLVELEAAGGAWYRLEDRLDKGLTPELLERCHVVVWDMPGTGMAECLAAGIPCLALWTRIYSSELPWARGIFADMEAVGLVHRTAQSLLDEVAKCMAEPAVWMANERRMGVAMSFCREYARIEGDWGRSWCEFLRGCRGPEDFDGPQRAKVG
jgi:hypothetical protein